jgi:hypothetical protein
MKNWQERALKTFVEAFFGVLVPGVVAMLSGGIDLDALKVTGGALVCSALAAGISATWNCVQDHLKEELE